jgi:hypothetical protein
MKSTKAAGVNLKIKKKALLILDETNFFQLNNNEKLHLKFSHDFYLIELAEELILRNYDVYITTGNKLSESNQVHFVHSFLPFVNFNKSYELNVPQFDIIASSAADLLILKESYSKALIICFFAAVHFIESPGLHHPSWLYNVAVALRLHIDIVITQHVRMAEFINLFGKLVCSVDLTDRIFTKPLGILEKATVSNTARSKLRKALGVENKILIGNAGGAWRWTDYLTFLKSYIKVARSESKLNLKLYITGLSQENNIDHFEYIKTIKNVLSKNQDLIDNSAESEAPIIYIEDWNEGGKLLQQILPLLDIGLNLNTPSIEAWQSYRVRLLDYIKHSIVVLTTGGDWITQQFDTNGFIHVESGNVDDYVQILKKINSGHLNLADIRSHQTELKNFLLNKNREKDLLDCVLGLGPRANKLPELLRPCLYDYAEDDAKRELLFDMEKNRKNWVHSFLNDLQSK